MITVAEALEIIARETPFLGSESVGLAEAVGRFLAEEIVADSDVPPFDRSQMDGYAVRAADTRSAPVSLKIVGESAAGKGWRQVLKKGEAVRIMTGAPVPTGADAVQKIEVTTESDNTVMILEPTEKGRFIVPRGSEIKSSERVFAAGEKVTSRMIAPLAAFGFAGITAAKLPKVNIMATGCEIVDISLKPGSDQIRNSNSPMLQALVENSRASTHILPITGDSLEQLRQRISEIVGMSERNSNKKPDILILTGGVSVGRYDLTKAAIHELGAEIFFEKVRLKPGKPTVFARLEDTLLFGLPGNPVSAAVTFYLFVRSAILRMQNANETEPRHGFAVVQSNVKGTKERDSYLPARLSTDKKGRLIAMPIRWHGSSDFIGFAGADALLVVPQGVKYASGDVAEILFLD